MWCLHHFYWPSWTWFSYFDYESQNNFDKRNDKVKRVLIYFTKEYGQSGETAALVISGLHKNFVPVGGVQQIQLRTENREKGDLEAVAP